VELQVKRASPLRNSDLRLFTQALFNRLMFLRFLERKGWLRFQGQHGRNYLAALAKAGGVGGRTFYRSRLRPLFFEGLALNGKQTADAYGHVPFLNGGLFDETELDRKVSDLPDELFPLVAGEDGLFYRYNFTVEESTPLDVEVAVDPEMLGKVFEELVTGRHESGSFYTPRPVVSFMCREALKSHLATTTTAPEKAIRRLVDQRQVEGLTEAHAAQVSGSLETIRAVDPACGSGAYLLGMLHELVGVRRALQSERLAADSGFLFQLKLGIISRNLFGADIDPFATSIAKLRLWLSLAVEADDPIPLPNLDFKIETGDSVVGPEPNDEAPDLFRGKLEDDAEKVHLLKDAFLVAHGRDKERLREQIEAAEHSIAKRLKAHVGPDVIDWRIQFADVFFGHGGFDVVLANPPYVRQELLEKAYKRQLLDAYGQGVTGKSDLFCFFYVRGLQLLRNGGAHIFVCSNSWLDVGYGGALQKYLLSNAWIVAIYDSAVERQFATADINTIISVIRKGRPADSAVTRFVSLRAPFLEAMASEDKRREVEVAQAELWNAGLGEEDEHGRRQYEGNKLGGKYLRAPGIFATVLKKGAPHLSRLSQHFRGERYLNTGGADGFFVLTDVTPTNAGKCLVVNDRCAGDGKPFEGEIESKYLRPLVKDVTKTEKRIEITQHDAYCLVVDQPPSPLLKRYITWGERQGYHERSVTISQHPWYKPTNQMKKGAPILVPRSFNDTFVMYSNPKELLSLRFYRLHALTTGDLRLIAFLNSTLCAFFFEVLGNKNLGQGVLDFFMADFLAMQIPLVSNAELDQAFRLLKTRPIGSIYEETGLLEVGDRLAVRPDRRALDDAVFDALGLTRAERDAVYIELVEMVRNRTAKAKSV
jgi:hypothetical protein